MWSSSFSRVATRSAFVRTPAKLRDNLVPLGVDPNHPLLEVASGDMTDPAAVNQAASGCDQAIHASATFSYRRRDAQRMLSENTIGTTTVLDAAINAGCTGIVHVSSFVALLRPGATLDHQARWASPSARTPRARWTQKAQPGRDRTPEPQSRSSTRAAYSGPTTPTSARVTKWSATSCGAGSLPGLAAACSGSTYKMSPRWSSQPWAAPGVVTWSPAKASPSHTRSCESSPAVDFPQYECRSRPPSRC